jgi:hypothetical protein
MTDIFIEQTVFEVVEPGQYKARVVGITKDSGQYGDFVKIKFELDDPDYLGVHVTGAASARFSVKSKLYKWTRAIAYGGRAIPADHNFTAGMLVGKGCVLNVDNVADTDGAIFNRVADVFPLRKAKVAESDNGDDETPL